MALDIDSQPSVFAAAPGTGEGTLVGRNAGTQVGFFGTTPIPRPEIPAEATAADIAAALVALGLVAQAS